jgi:hypothetical protein
MVQMMKSCSRYVLTALLIAPLAVSTLLNGCQRGTKSLSRPAMTDLSPRLTALFENTRTVCFGRFLMKVPVTASIIFGPAEVETPIEYFEGQGDKVTEHLAARLVEVEEEREYLLKDDIPNLPLFGKVMDGARPGQKIVFGSKDRVSYAIYSFVPVGRDLFVQYLDVVLPEYDRVTTFNRVASHLRSRSEDDIPAEQGTCIEGGFVPLEQKYERVTIGFRLKEFPDVHFSVDAHKNLDRLREGSSPSLLREQAKEAAEADGLGAVFARTKILRQQARELGTWKGEELALRTPAYKDDLEAHEFYFHSMGAVNDPLQPELDVRLESGLKGNQKARVKPSLTDEEALALWDKLIGTIRVRQPSDASSAMAPRVPLASLAGTGDTCPQTGWWESTEIKNEVGDKKRLLKAGEPMPHALVRSELGLWQKLIGDRPSRKIAVVWKLVAYEDELAAQSLAATNTTLAGERVEEPARRDVPPAAG